MNKKLSPRDWEILSAYIDGQLSNGKRVQLEARLQINPDLRAALDDLTRTRAMLRSLPRVKAPRSFKLTPQMVGQPEPRRLYPFFQLASALSSVLLVLVLLTDFLGFSFQNPLGRMASQSPASDVGAEVLMENAPPGILAEEIPEARKSMPEEPVEPAAQDQVEGLMVLATPSAEEQAAEAELYSVAPAPVEGEVTPEIEIGGAGSISESVSPDAPPAALPDTAFQEAEPQTDTLLVETDAVPDYGLSGMRVLQISLALVAAGSALAALYLRRVGA